MDTTNAVPPAAAVVALKPSEYAKSRLELPVPLRQRLAETMALDTLRALATIVSAGRRGQRAARPGLAAEPGGVSATVLPDPAQPGMNAALAYGADRLRADGFGTVLACVGDLPALRAASVSPRARASARSFPRAFLADASGVGTTMLVANDVPLLPALLGSIGGPPSGGRGGAAHR